MKYGHDPRAGAEEGDTAWAAALAAGKVNSLVTIEQLQGVLEAAEASSQLVVLKFKRVGCAACASTEKQYAQTAHKHEARAKFFEVDYDEAKPFCKKCEVRFVPSAHLYRGTTFLDALALGKNSWEKFVARFDEEVAQ